MKNFVRNVIAISLLGSATMAHAAFPIGEWTVNLWNDINTSAPPNISSYKICIESNGIWRVQNGTQSSPSWNGKWFNKGNNVHLLSVHSSGQYATSMEVSRVTDSSMSGYRQWINYPYPSSPAVFEVSTTVLSFNSATCSF
jgi:hypothetical protein